MADLFDCSDPDPRAAGLDAAAAAIGRGELVLLPTDTVYGVAADAFTPAAVTGLLAAKNRGRHMPVPVLIGEASTLAGLVVNLPPVAHELAEAFWPGGLTLVLEHAPSLAWDLGDAEGTVAVRLPDDDVARDLLRRTGPLAVSSANRSGRPAATTAQEAVDQLGDARGRRPRRRPARRLGGQHDRRLHRRRRPGCCGRARSGLDRLREVVPDLTRLSGARPAASTARRRSLPRAIPGPTPRRPSPSVTDAAPALSTPDEHPLLGPGLRRPGRLRPRHRRASSSTSWTACAAACS